MPKYYSLDLREKVLEYVGKHGDKKAASEVFQIGIASVYRWVAQKKEKGHLLPKRRKYAYKKVDDQKLIDYVNTYPDRFLSEIGDHFNLTPQTIFYALKRLKITRKKRPRCIRKEVKK